MENGQKSYKYNPKPEFEARMNALLKDEADRKAFWAIVHKEPQATIRCNTLKIKPQELKKRLEKHEWSILQPFQEYPEIMIIDKKTGFLPGEIGKAVEHLLGYYYIQEISSMLPLIALKPSQEESFLDCCASPGSKTTQAAAMMNNKGALIANDNDLGRIRILASNLEKCGVSNALVTRMDSAQLCKKFKQQGMAFDKILVDAPCSGEGTLRSSPEVFITWNRKMIEKFSRTQKVLASSALEVLNVGGEMIYSTCTHSPEEDETVVQFLLDNFDIEVEHIELPIKTRPGIASWEGKTFDKQISNCARVYPQDNDTEGFFIAKIKKLSEKNRREHSS